jgi:hypothetical protein
VSKEASKALGAELIRPLMDSWWTIVAGICIGLAAALVSLRRVPPPPEGPAEMQVFALGIVVGLMVFVGPPVVRSAVNPVIFNEPTIRGLTDVPFLAGIPRVSTQDTREAARRRLLLNAVLSVVAAIVLVATVFVLWT